MAPQKKRKSAEISASSTAEGKTQDTAKITKKKQKTKDTKSTPATRRSRVSSLDTPRLTRSASNVTGANNSTAKSPSTGTPRHQKNGSPKASSKVTKKGTRKPTKSEEAEGEEKEDHPQANVSVALPAKKKKTKAKTKKEQDVDDSENDADSDGHQYWLMKAEPESRIEKGKDVKFSIDDLKASSNPEPWDGVRNLEARNNMRAMTKGDLAFFYHSNCKVPGIFGIMEIVEEHSVDESAFDQDHPYYDEKSSRENPKWHLVHVAFKQKFPEMIKLKELQKFSKEGGTLENMQAMRRSRLSVSKVSKKEWDFIMSLVDLDDEENDNVPPAEGSDEPKTYGMPQVNPEANGEKTDSAETTTDATKAGEGDIVVQLNAEAKSVAAEPGDSAVTA